MVDNQHARRRVTYNQLQTLWEFLNTHRQVGSGYNKSAQAREHSKQMWGRAASILNSAGEGAVKSGPEWSKYWVDFKAKIKRKNRMIRDARSRTDGSPCTEQTLSEIELKFLRIVGEDDGSGLPSVQVDPLSREQESESTSSPEVPSQTTTSNESVEAIYLEVDFPEEFKFDQEPSTSSAQIPPPLQPSANPIRIRVSPLPSGSFIPPGATQRENRNLLRIRRRQRLQRSLTASAARAQLVAASKARARAEFASSRSIAQGVSALREISHILRRIEAKLPGEAPIGE